VPLYVDFCGGNRAYTETMKRVLFVCTGNKARSQMAEGLLRHLAGCRFEVHSAGTQPSGLADETVAVMREIGIDTSGQRSKHVDEFLGLTFDYVITVCDSADRHARLPGRQRLHWTSGGGSGTQGFRPNAFRKRVTSEGIEEFARTRPGCADAGSSQAQLISTSRLATRTRARRAAPVSGRRTSRVSTDSNTYFPTPLRPKMLDDDGPADSPPICRPITVITDKGVLSVAPH
jgi:arsenate reductase